MHQGKSGSSPRRGIVETWVLQGLEGFCRGCIGSSGKEMEHDMETAPGCMAQGFKHLPIMENRLEKKVENKMATTRGSRV